MNRRVFLIGIAGFAAFTAVQFKSNHNKINVKAGPHITKWHHNEEFWRKRLTAVQYAILRTGGTEPRYSSELTNTSSIGTYHCIGCDLKLFTSDMKYDSQTGWPSFMDHVKGHLETYTDFKSFWPATAYRCAQCGGHHGHLIMDGPLPTGQRWCNNGQVLKFKPA